LGKIRGMKKLDAQNIKKIAHNIYGSAKAEEILGHKRKNSDHGEFDQPLPDVIGLKQHDSECASDAIQEVLLFADGIREYTQPILYGITKEQAETRTTLSLDHDEWTPLQDYFHYIQKRFRAHYDVINYIRTHKIDAQQYYDKYDDVCLLNPLFKQKEATSIEAGVLALKHYKGEKIYKGTGLSFKKTVKVINGLLKTLNVPYERDTGVDTKSTGIIIFCKKATINAEGDEQLNSLGHVVAFFKALGKWVYYDNNMGFLNVDEKVVEALKEGNLRIVNYRKVYFVKSNKSNVYESAWNNGKWDKELVKNLYEGGKKIQGMYLYFGHPTQCSSIKFVEPESSEEIHKKCNITKAELKPKNSEEVIATMTKFRNCIYANLETNSKIFENMYRFIYESIELVKETPSELEFVEKSIKSVITRPACSPLTHYWCSKINMELKGRETDSMKWFKIPEVRRLGHHRERYGTPPEMLKKLLDDKEAANAETASIKLTPCLPGQVRNSKTLKCRDRAKREPKLNNEGNPIKREKKEKNNATKKSKCPKGEERDSKTGLCVPKKEPCPPGQVRDKNTGDCRGRLAGKACPEGQVRDKKTKKCRDKEAYKF
jgi:hypothetical protein